MYQWTTYSHLLRHHPVLCVLRGHGLRSGVLAAGGAQGGHSPGGGGLQASGQLPHSGEVQVSQGKKFSYLLLEPDVECG